MKVGIDVVSSEDGGEGGHKQRNTGGHKKLKKGRELDFPLRASRRSQPC